MRRVFSTYERNHKYKIQNHLGDIRVDGSTLSPRISGEIRVQCAGKDQLVQNKGQWQASVNMGPTEAANRLIS
jgi:hypothetical protein